MIALPPIGAISQSEASALKNISRPANPTPISPPSAERALSAYDSAGVSATRRVRIKVLRAPNPFRANRGLDCGMLLACPTALQTSLGDHNCTFRKMITPLTLQTQADPTAASVAGQIPSRPAATLPPPVHTHPAVALDEGRHPPANPATAGSVRQTPGVRGQRKRSTGSRSPQTHSSLFERCPCLGDSNAQTADEALGQTFLPGVIDDFFDLDHIAGD